MRRDIDVAALAFGAAFLAVVVVYVVGRLPGGVDGWWVLPAVLCATGAAALTGVGLRWSRERARR